MRLSKALDRSCAVAAVLAVAACAALASRADGQQQASTPPAPVHSIGQPPQWQPFVGVTAIGSIVNGTPGARMLAGIDHPLFNPVTGLLDVTGESYLGTGGAGSAAGVRVLAAARTFGVSAGADWGVEAGTLDLMLSYRAAVRRGGLLGRGSMMRIDWLPTRGHELSIGVQLPLMQPLAGRTRPRTVAWHVDDSLRADASRSSASVLPQARGALSRMSELVPLIDAYTNAYSDEALRRLADPRSVDYENVLRSYEQATTEAFAAAVGDSRLGEAVGRRARTSLLEDVLLPYNAAFGQPRERAAFAMLTSRARARVTRWLGDSSTLSTDRQGAAARILDEWLEQVAVLERAQRADHEDSRVVWLPLQLALVADEYDEQHEVDSLVGRAIGRPFTDRNALAYLNSADLPLEIARSIYAAKDYHVLWMHDIPGTRQSGALDNIAYNLVADVYFPALTEAVKRYDSTGTIPVYMVLLDQFYHGARNSRIWMTLLEDPLSAKVRLPGDNAPRERHLAERQEALRQAVAASTRLQRDGRESGEAEWLRRTVKVHVNVTYPTDFSFRSSRIVPPIAGVPDNIMRDHRKIAVYDVSDADPYRGAMLLMGVGVGEHYASATWEDRGYRIRGPAALEVLDAVRRVLLENGYRERDIPPALLRRDVAATTERQMDRGDYVGRALQVHNEVGFGPKQASVVRALLYNLAPPGSVIIVPDPLWLSAEWAGMLAAAAARGSRVFIIAPALANAPSPQPPLMAVQRDVLHRLLQVQAALRARPTPARGELRLGLFSATAPVNDVIGRAAEIRAGLSRAPWIKELIPFDTKTLAVLDNAKNEVATDGRDATQLATDEKPRAPQLHQKTELIALPGAIAALARLPGWDGVIAQSMRAQSRQSVAFAEQMEWRTPDVDSTAVLASDRMLNAFEQSRSDTDRKRVSFYFNTGTQNHDPRGIMLDGEVSLLVSGFHAAPGLVDLYYLMARSDWIATPEELDRHLPAPSGFMRWLGRLFRAAM